MQLEPPLSLRPADPDDRGFERDLYATTRQDLLAAPMEPAQLEQLITLQFDAQTLQYRTTYPDATRELVLLADEPVGRLIISRGEAAIVLVDIALIPELRGRGFGSLILRSLLGDAASERVSVRLQVALTNPARRLYLRLGFTERTSNGVHAELEWVPDRGPG